MRFSGSAVSAGEVQNIVTSSVLKQNIDYFFWPAISGESFPHAFSGIIQGASLGQPAYNLKGTQSQTTMTSVFLPRVGLNGKQNVTYKWNISFAFNGVVLNPFDTFRIGNSNNNINFSFACNGATAVVSIAINCVNNNVTHTQNFNNVATISQNLTGVNQSLYIPFEVDIAANGVITISINGVVVATTTTALWPATFTDARDATSTLQLFIAMAGNINFYGQAWLNGLLVEWT